MIEYEYEPPRAPIREIIKIDGEPVGEMWHNGNGWQCSFKFGPLIEDGNYSHMGGVGQTKTEAIKKAVANAMDEAGRLWRAAMFIGERMGGI